MIAKLYFLTAFLAAIEGNVIQTARQENTNTYFLYTRSYDNALTLISMESQENQTIVNYLDPALDTIVLVHGHDEDRNSDVILDIKNAFFDEASRGHLNVNFIVVDWSSNSKQSYRQASDSVKTIGDNLADYLNYLIDTKRIDITRLHLIGFNLGAHIVGFAGRGLNGLVPRITGLDPAGSRWGPGNPHLTSSDARYVEVIHTDGSGIGANGIGTAIGDVDFFINGGCNQPGCLAVNHSCNHNRAYQLFAATLVRPEPIYGNHCSSSLALSTNRCTGFALPVGGDALFKRHGNGNIYRANTRRSFPY